MDLKYRNAKAKHLRMACCDRGVILKTSKLGTRFFAHAKRGDCATAPESEHHLALKAMAARVIESCGWHVETEVRGTTPGGIPWIADLLATRGRAKVAVEVQWSSQTNEETLSRQTRYAASGVRGLWMLRQAGFPTTKDLPAGCVVHDDTIDGDDAYQILIPNQSLYYTAHDKRNPRLWHQAMSVREFIRAAFSGRLRHGRETHGGKGKMFVCADWDPCKRCGYWNRPVGTIGLKFAGSEYFGELGVKDFAYHMEVLQEWGVSGQDGIYIVDGQNLCKKCGKVYEAPARVYVGFRTTRGGKRLVEAGITISPGAAAVFNSVYGMHWHVAPDPAASGHDRASLDASQQCIP
ncbi:competence protein CoiA family protein [Cupriavidus sp. D39]|uniref:competence protein CoiA family protein n=1 Tax=Cupriavidus sp. D39 TaxID=2997877 RepID=UPI0022718D7C|nr:competence protein CoiA family protein [Cupriavidus sp. D39]MCY0854067.1 competence protein CoiA family protein [Cupriavidus sp. D39]